MTTYRSDDLEGWEFKIVRSLTGAFSKPEKVEQLRRDEAQAGWEMIEKFDNNRIRFKRRTDRRANDHLLPFDPYRTNYGIGEGRMAAVVITSMVVVIGLVIVLALLFGDR
ncbi:MAG TPA: hypothetical protein PK186_08865 [candidate division Zixibacteria bacterium]|nr:hypothetical protein [candidate division Zixibacteria bacterium]MDD4916346.1 hypothetical protein [candidate division Zixibacteria bacterium]HOD66364.1 hypothetical protein [candidate division Zixibacteria bacterium]HPM37651.1 hypothetical protein [candidate division Zixibacteria bacterium]